VRFLTLPAAIERLALFDKVPRIQEVDVELVFLESGYRLIMCDGFETGTNVKGMFFILA
jgi:hypothetical protein